MSSSASLNAIPAEHARELAPLFLPLIRRSAGRLDIASLQRLLHRREWIMWCVMSGTPLAWVLTSSYEAPSGLRVFRIEGVVGRQRKLWLHLMQELMDAARLNGCALIECHARLGWRGEIPGLAHVANYLEARL